MKALPPFSNVVQLLVVPAVCVAEVGPSAVVGWSTRLLQAAHVALRKIL